MNQDYSSNSCQAYVKGSSTSYGYVPSFAAGVAFVALFGFSMVAHTAQMALLRSWWCAVFAIGCLVEILGWGARIWSNKCPYAQTPYLMQITTLIIAPTFFTAGIYVLLGRLIRICGPQSSVLSPKLYLWIFCTCDIISLVVQAAGGGMASSGGGGEGGGQSSSSSSSGTTSSVSTRAQTSSSSSNQTTGTHLMVGGIIFQLISITVFVGFAVDFLWRVLKRSKSLVPKSRTMLALFAATAFSVLLIYIRSIYRTIELMDGWTSSTMQNESLLIGLDGAMMVPAVIIYNLFHPGWMLAKIERNAELPTPIPLLNEQELTERREQH
ncbi:RTA1 like protein-domain-containing protein [Aspergillus multicolor]|uniref:RTA1 domain-containing protein n=1 Tax=Aspergillus multicolor TaxID=41759 RepID=UPI003CCE3215